MSSKRWVDGLFRERLEHRKFPVEEGEFDAVRALLEKRNMTPPVGAGGKPSAWWLATLLPVAALLWWSSAATDMDPVGHTEGEATRTEQVGNTFHTTSGATKTGRGTTSSPEVVLGALTTTARTAGKSADEGPFRTTMNDQISDRSTFSKECGGRSTTSRSTRSSSSPNGVSLDGPGLASQYGEGYDDQLSIDVASSPAEVELLGTRWTFTSAPEIGIPIHRAMELPKHRASGELHAFGAPLSVRTRLGGEEEPTPQAGSLFGLEYRVRSRYLSIATGIHYGTYGLKSGQAQAEVKLNYVEVPVLAGIELGFRRFGVLVQGGMSLDFLFDSGGRYPTDDARPGSGFPDDAFTTLNYSWMIRPQVSYQVNEHLSLSAGPVWKTQLSNVAEKGSLKDARAFNTGISAGFTWHLDRSTF